MGVYDGMVSQAVNPNSCPECGTENRLHGRDCYPIDPEDFYADDDLPQPRGFLTASGIHVTGLRPIRD